MEIVHLAIIRFLSIIISAWCAIRLAFLPGVAGAQTSGVGLRAPEGFAVTWYADDDLAHDIFSMTTDAQGHVWVSGAGYLRVLMDRDGDGRADHSQLFADAPRSGAQGLWCEGSEIYCVGDGGLLRFTDRDQDLQADGPPEKLVPLRTSSEHHAHAVRRGPDGFLYVIAGNDTGIDSRYAGSGSPVDRPKAGVLLRIDPEKFTTTIVCDGFRNAYDFDFDTNGRIYVYDSDDERDVSFPWYRPTRVIQVLSGGTAGWFTRTWKPPDSALDLMPVVARLGRGSPTGVVWYNHRMFPRAYRQTLFVADWTFGRVVVVRPRYDPSTGTWTSTLELFLQSDGSIGFAPTDLAVGVDGALYVSVGGRGTRGSVYRISWPADLATGKASPPESVRAEINPSVESSRTAAASETELPKAAGKTESKSLEVNTWASLLDAPDFFSPAGRRRWEDQARALGSAALCDAMLDPTLPELWRVRAVQIHASLFGGLPTAIHRSLQQAPVPLRISAAWCWGRWPERTAPEHVDITMGYLSDVDPCVVRALFDGLCGQDYLDSLADNRELCRALARALSGPARDVRQQAVYTLSRSSRKLRENVADQMKTLSFAGLITLAAAAAKAGDPPTHWIGAICEQLHPNVTTGLLLDAVRTLQLLAGDARTFTGKESVLDGYSLDKPEWVLELDRARMHQLLRNLYPTGSAEVDRELERLAAMIQSEESMLRQAILQHCDATSSPTDDIHRLVVLSRLTGTPDPTQLKQIAEVWALIEHKIHARGWHTDRHWPVRWQELLKIYLDRDARFAQALVEAESFGHPGHCCLLPLLPEACLAKALDRIWQWLDKYPEEEWPAELARAAVRTGRVSDRQRLVARMAGGADQATIIEALAENPHPSERPWYREALYSHSPSTVRAAVAALALLPPSDSIEETAALISALRKLGGDPINWEARQTVSRLLERVVPENFGFIYGTEGHRAQPWVVEGWRHWLQHNAPHLVEKVFGHAADSRQLDELLAQVNWQQGDALRGQKIAQRKGCSQCHSSRYALGPDLSGITRRFSRYDLFRVIAFPNLDVSPRYQTRLVETVDGRIVQGAVIYESVDGITLVTPEQRTVRIEQGQIARQENSPLSLMPAGLLEDLTLQDLADLYAWLATL